ncbi:hypothetical protein ACGH2B_02520 [Streptomyces sp. BBFR2]|uniref:hypothetical protein n=1 Tax=Streptomyces sp. BBFR2 TaxID=3372854 RepID=UPI0037D9B7E0
MAHTAANGAPHHHSPDDGAGAAGRRAGDITVGGSVSGGVLSTGADARIDYRAPQPLDVERLLPALTALHAALRPEGGGSDLGAVVLGADVASAQEEIRSSGTLAPTRRQLLRERLELVATAGAGGASLATLAQTVVGLLS